MILKGYKVKQKIIEGKNSYKSIGECLRGLGVSKYMLVYTNSAKKLPVWKYLEGIDIPSVLFSGFTPNPKYEEIAKGVDIFNAENCDGIVAVGGGSAIDVAKCIKLYCKMSKDTLYLKQEYTDTGVPFIAMPTTAGTGSESTPFSVIYYGGEKQSVKHMSILPDVAILDSDVLESLPVYQKKCTVLDALCQAIESWWSVYSTEESKTYAKIAVEKIVNNIYEYVEDNTEKARDEIMSASNYAGRAICITSTTAPHAMCYKLTTTYEIPHGHAVALGLPRVWKYMLSHPERCTDTRGVEYLFGIFSDIAKSLGCETPEAAADGFEAMLTRLELNYPEESEAEKRAQYFADSVNVERLGNNPVALDNEALYHLYKGMFK
jgi:alcohol dehydrogenase class IV